MNCRHKLIPCGAFLFLVSAWSAAAGAAEAVEAITRPSGDVTLSFIRPGRIDNVLVKEGDVVAPGQVLVQLDDAAERAQLAQLEAQAKDETRTKAAEAQVAVAKVKLERLKKAEVPPIDIDQAALEVTIADLSLDLARFEHEQNRRRFEEAKLQIDRMRLLSPIGGKVEHIPAERGESVDALAPVIRVVKIDPLRVDAPVPLDAAKKLALGQAAEVEFAGSERPTLGKITFIAGVADAASNTLTVRVEVANPAGRQAAGERVKVRFPGQGAAPPSSGSEK